MTQTAQVPTNIRVRCSRCNKVVYVPLTLQGKIHEIEDASNMLAVWNEPSLTATGPIGWVCKNGCKKS